MSMRQHPSPPSRFRRFSGAVSLLAVAGAFLILPLCVAISLCGMPCCHRDDAPRSVAGPTPCETACSADDGFMAPLASPFLDGQKAGEHSLSADAAFVAERAPSGWPLLIAGNQSAHPSAATPLNILHSTFRI